MFLEILMLWMSPFFGLLFSSGNAGLEALIFFYPGIALLYIYMLPFVLSIIYLLFGDGFFLFSWVDSVLSFYIEHLLSNFMPIFFISIYSMSYVAV